MSEKSLLVLDIGTSSTKAALYSSVGKLLEVQSEDYSVHFPRAGWAEQNPIDWWDTACRCTQKILHSFGASMITAVCVSGQAPSCVPIDEKGEPLAPAILWLDRRSTDQVGYISKIVGEENVTAVSGNKNDSYFGGPKWLWFKQNNPELYRKTWKILQASSFIIFHLTGEAVIDPSQAGLCGPFFDIGSGQWDAEMCDRLELDIQKLPAIFPSSKVIGEVTPQGALQSGIPAGVPVLCGGGDFAFSCLGAGVFRQGDAALMLGTAGNLLIPDPFERDVRLLNTYHVTGQRLALGGVYAGGSVNWMSAVLDLQGSSNLTMLDQEASSIPPGSDGLIFLPYLMGERSPIWDPYARGIFFGLSAAHTRAHLFRAVLEGVAYAFRSVAEIVAAQGGPITGITATDGGSRSRLWREILADVLQVPILWRRSSGGTLLGAAFLAAYSSEMVSDFHSIYDWLPTGEAVEPEGDVFLIYEQGYRVFTELYERNRTLFPRSDAG